MKIVLNIPKQYEKYFNKDKFKENLEYIKEDVENLDVQESKCWLIDIDVLKMLIKSLGESESICDTCSYRGGICNVKPERNGYWIEHDYEKTYDRVDYELPYECSECGHRQGIWTHRYCPGCGAKMSNGK